MNAYNSGRTPALDVVLPEISVGDSETRMIRTAPSTDRAVIAPNNNEMFYSSASSSNDVIEGLKAGKIRVYVKGRIEYKDIFGRSHKTTFCGYYPTGQPLPNFFNCGSGNYME